MSRDISLKKKSHTAIRKSVIYQRKLVREDGSIREPDLPFYACATSVSISAALEAKLGNYILSKKIAQFLPVFFKNGIFYLYYKNGRLYHGAKWYQIETTTINVLKNITLYELYLRSNPYTL